MKVETGNDSGIAVDDNTSPAKMELTACILEPLKVLSSKEDALQRIENPEEILSKLELDLAYSSEKLVNFNVLVIHVAMREHDFEAFLSEEEPSFGESAHNALEFDILSGFLDSEVNVHEKFVSTLQNEITRISDFIPPCEKLDDCEESLKQSLEQLSEMKEQSANFQKIIGTPGTQDKDTGLSGVTSLSGPATKIKMQTTEQERHILRLLERSLAREIDLERQLNESRRSQELLNLRLQEELVFMEGEAEAVMERSFRAENDAAILLSTSKELLGRLQVMQFSPNGVSQREESLNFNFQDYSALIEEKNQKLLEQERTIEELLNNDCRSLREANVNLEKELNHFKRGCISASNRVEQLERQLQEADKQLAHAVASADASLEKQAMLNSTMKDMDNLITTLKSKVSVAENQIEVVEEKCIILSETNADLREELSFLRGKIYGLEASLHEVEKQRKATTKAIIARAKVITNLVVQLALERERLHKQVDLLRKDNKAIENYSPKIQKKNPSVDDLEEPTKAAMEPDITFKKCTNEVTDTSTTNSEVIKASRNISENVKHIDAWQMNFNYILFTMLAVLMSSAVAFWIGYRSGRM